MLLEKSAWPVCRTSAIRSQPGPDDPSLFLVTGLLLFDVLLIAVRLALWREHHFGLPSPLPCLPFFHFYLLVRFPSLL